MVINFMDMVISLILIVFPMLMYLVFSCYNILMNNRMRRVLLIMTICTSFYLSLNIDIGYKEVMIFCNIPILICYLKKEWMLGVILSILAIFNGYVKYDINIYIMIVKFLGYLICYFSLRKRKDFNSLFLKISAVIQGFFISFEYFMRTDNGIDSILKLFMATIMIYFMTFCCLYLFRKPI